MPIDRSGASAAEGALSAAKRILGEGDLFGIYPEGTRSHDGRLYRGKTGVARLALETGVPVIPVAVVGTDVVAPPGKKFGRLVRPVVRFGKPLDFSRYEGMENDRYILRSVTDEIMYEIMRLSGQEYVDQYAARAKEESKRAEQAGRRRAEEGVLSREIGWRRPETTVEDRLFRALAVLRVVLLVNAVGLNLYRADNFQRPVAGLVLVLVMVGWTAFTVWAYADPARRTGVVLGLDLAVALALLLATPLVKGAGFSATVPGFWVMGALLAWAVHWRWRGGLAAALVLAVADLAIREDISQTNYGNAYLLVIGASSSAGWRSRCSGWPSAATPPSARRPRRRSGHGSPEPCTTACCRCSPSCSAAGRSSAARRPSWAGWPVSRRPCCAA